MFRRSITAVGTGARSTRRAVRTASTTVSHGWNTGVGRIAASDTSSNPELRAPVARPSERAILRLSGATMTMVGILLLGFVAQVIGVSQLSEVRSQSLLYQNLRYELADATAPVAQVDQHNHLYALGTPVALLQIPVIGVRQVVVEGTTSGAMLEGPGHRRDTPLPGQTGVSVIMGRQAAYGGPFGAIGELAAGDKILATTGQGTSTYVVTDVRYAGDPQPDAVTPQQGRLTLVSATGTPYIPTGVVRVDATLSTKPYITPNPVLLIGSLTPAEGELATDPSGWLPLTFLLEAAIAAIILFSLALRRWGRWQTWIVATPVALLLGASIAQQVVVLLPNLY